MLKPVYIKIKERYGKPCKPVYVTKPASPRWQSILQVSNLWVHVAFPYLKGRQKKTGQIFCVRQVYFTKSCQQIWWCVKQPFILFIHLIWGKQYYEALFFYYTEKRMFSHANRPRAECSLKVFTIFQDQLHSQLIFITIEARASFAQQIIKLTTLWNICMKIIP